MEKKVALYARVSTERQEQAGTIESHVAELESYAQEQGYEIDEELIFLDQAVSGACLARPALDRLRDLAVIVKTRSDTHDFKLLQRMN